MRIEGECSYIRRRKRLERRFRAFLWLMLMVLLVWAGKKACGF